MRRSRVPRFSGRLRLICRTPWRVRDILSLLPALPRLATPGSVAGPLWPLAHLIIADRRNRPSIMFPAARTDGHSERHTRTRVCPDNQTQHRGAGGHHRRSGRLVGARPLHDRGAGQPPRPRRHVRPGAGPVRAAVRRPGLLASDRHDAGRRRLARLRMRPVSGRDPGAEGGVGHSRDRRRKAREPEAGRGLITRANFRRRPAALHPDSMGKTKTCKIATAAWYATCWNCDEPLSDPGTGSQLIVASEVDRDTTFLCEGCGAENRLPRRAWAASGT